LNHFYDLKDDQKTSFEEKSELCESEFEKSLFTFLFEEAELHELENTVISRTFSVLKILIYEQ
jgi:hypothetical protein